MGLHAAAGPLADADHRIGAIATHGHVLQVPAEQGAIKRLRRCDIGRVELDMYERVRHWIVLMLLHGGATACCRQNMIKNIFFPSAIMRPRQEPPAMPNAPQTRAENRTRLLDGARRLANRTQLA